eukprot:scaffold2263_cov391-Prasinococcus_capsulatus_cf.AAC.3
MLWVYFHGLSEKAPRCTKAPLSGAHEPQALQRRSVAWVPLQGLHVALFGLPGSTPLFMKLCQCMPRRRMHGVDFHSFEQESESFVVVSAHSLPTPKSLPSWGLCRRGIASPDEQLFCLRVSAVA